MPLILRIKATGRERNTPSFFVLFIIVAHQKHKTLKDTIELCYCQCTATPTQVFSTSDDTVQFATAEVFNRSDVYTYLFFMEKNSPKYFKSYSICQNSCDRFSTALSVTVRVLKNQIQRRVAMFSFMKSCVGQSSISEQRTDRNKNMTRLCAKGRYDGGESR